MQVVSLKIKNFLSLQDVEIKPGQVTQVVGKNNQGKTSIIKALQFAIKGGADESVVRQGEDAAEVVVELSDATTIRRRISKTGNQSVTVSRDGMKASQPQAMLDQLFETSAFNPLDLIEPKRRNDAILQAIDIKVTPEKVANELGIDVKDIPPMIDFTQHGLKVIDQVHKYLYQRRAEANKVAEEKSARFKAYEKDLPQIPDYDMNEQSFKIHSAISEIDQKITELGGKKRANDLKIATIKKSMERVENYKRAIKTLEEEKRNLQWKIQELDTRIVNGNKELETSESDLKELGEPVTESVLANELLALNNQRGERMRDLKQLEVDAGAAKQHQMVAGMREESFQAKQDAVSLDKKVEIIKAFKNKLMGEAEMPITGLAFTENGFTVDGVPVDNLSSSRALQLAVGVARKLAKKTKLICIDGAEQLDEEAYAALRKEIDGDGYTYFLTKVGEPFPSEQDAVVRMSGGQVLQ